MSILYFFSSLNVLSGIVLNQMMFKIILDTDFWCSSLVNEKASICVRIELMAIHVSLLASGRQNSVSLLIHLHSVDRDDANEFLMVSDEYSIVRWPHGCFSGSPRPPFDCLPPVKILRPAGEDDRTHQTPFHALTIDKLPLQKHHSFHYPFVIGF